ncbi:hypothetical protein LWI29_021100 [Acer saccharum]|uniref:Uncharacterized protein n=1 Tax=Acer saccharum TaxID=4024 RepID=A0AA39RM79_ACESA|nr:hypothetical protein LWI29_021100 [Acer saccharum]
MVEGDMVNSTEVDISSVVQLSDKVDDISSRVSNSMDESDKFQQQVIADGDRGRLGKEDVMIQDSGSQPVNCDSHQPETEGSVEKSNGTAGAAINGDINFGMGNCGNESRCVTLTPPMDRPVNYGLDICNQESSLNNKYQEWHRPDEVSNVEAQDIYNKAQPSPSFGPLLGSETSGLPGTVYVENKFGVKMGILIGSDNIGKMGSSVFHKRVRDQKVRSFGEILEKSSRKRKSEPMVKDGSGGSKKARKLEGSSVAGQSSSVGSEVYVSAVEEDDGGGWDDGGGAMEVDAQMMEVDLQMNR